MTIHLQALAELDGLPFWLAEGLARRQGLRLGTALSRGLLSRDDVRAMLSSCSSCAAVMDCIDYLSERPGAPVALPLGCANLPMLQRLSRVR